MTRRARAMQKDKTRRERQVFQRLEQVFTDVAIGAKPKDGWTSDAVAKLLAQQVMRERDLIARYLVGATDHLPLAPAGTDPDTISRRALITVERHIRNGKHRA